MIVAGHFTNHLLDLTVVVDLRAWERARVSVRLRAVAAVRGGSTLFFNSRTVLLKSLDFAIEATLRMASMWRVRNLLRRDDASACRVQSARCDDKCVRSQDRRAIAHVIHVL